MISGAKSGRVERIRVAINCLSGEERSFQAESRFLTGDDILLVNSRFLDPFISLCSGSPVRKGSHDSDKNSDEDLPTCVVSCCGFDFHGKRIIVRR